jgi:hypothetical protein
MNVVGLGLLGGMILVMAVEEGTELSVSALEDWTCLLTDVALVVVDVGIDSVVDWTDTELVVEVGILSVGAVGSVIVIVEGLDAELLVVEGLDAELLVVEGLDAELLVVEGLDAELLVSSEEVDIAGGLLTVAVTVTRVLPLETRNTHVPLDEQHHGATWPDES